MPVLGGCPGGLPDLSMPTRPLLGILGKDSDRQPEHTIISRLYRYNICHLTVLVN